MKLNLLHIEPDYKWGQGVTLIELIISLSLVGIILAVVFNLYSNGVKSYNDSISEYFIMQNARQAIMRLSSAVRLARDVKIISQNKIQIVTPDFEKIFYYLDRNVIYREKNYGKNPITDIDVESLKFIQPKGSKYIEIYIKVKKDGRFFELKTKATPFGSIIK